MPLFTTITQHVVKELKARYLSIQPLVAESDREAWESYSVQNHWWHNESLILQGQEPINKGYLPFIYRFNYTDFTPIRDTVPPNPYYAPVWQVRCCLTITSERGVATTSLTKIAFSHSLFLSGIGQF